MNLVAPITSFYFGILSIYYLFLSFNVIKERFKALVAIGDGTTQTIRRIINASKTNEIDQVDPTKYEKLAVAVRMHGNFAEFVPVIGILSLLCELNGASSTFLHIILSLVVFGRIAHVSGLNGKLAIGLGRRIGVGITLLSILLTSLCCIYIPLKYYYF